MQVKADLRGFEESDLSKDADRLAGDAIANYKMIQSFGCDNEIMEEYAEILKIPTQKDVSNGHRFGCTVGLGQVMVNVVFGIVWFAQA